MTELRIKSWLLVGMLASIGLDACNSGGSGGSSMTTNGKVNTLAATSKVSSEFVVNTLVPNDWYSDWSSAITKLPEDEQLSLKQVQYYVSADNVNIDAIKPGANTNPENVQRVERLMPQANFEKVFLLTKSMDTLNGFVPGKTYSYSNFLKAVAVVPGYCGDFKTYPGAKSSAMQDPDTVCKRMLATTFAHAVQETSDVVSNANDPIANKIARTFASVAEANSTPNNRVADRYVDLSGPFSDNGSQKELVKGKYYYGRGAKQLSYPSNYANLSLMLYSDLTLVETPDLVQAENILPFLSAIVYAVQPKNGRPSIAEIMDGSFKLHAKGNALKYAEKGFPFTIALVNGGPECKGKNIENTQTRLRSFRQFAEAGELFVSGFELTAEEKNAANCDDIDYMDTSITDAAQRYYYVNQDNCSLVKWDSGYPIFGGEKFKQLICDTNQHKLIIKSMGSMAINDLKISSGSDANALPYINAGATVVLPNDVSWVDFMGKYQGKEDVVSFSPTWENNKEVPTEYKCPAFNFNKDTTLEITTSNVSSVNKCIVIQ